MSQYFETILPSVESLSSSRQDEVIISWVVALLETCKVTNMAAILDLPGVRNQVKTERIGIFCDLL